MPLTTAGWRLQLAAALLPPVLGGRPASPWTSAGPPGSSSPANEPPWPSATAAVSSRAVTGPWPGVRLTTCGTGWMAAPPTWPTWYSCAGPITGRSMTAAGSLPDNPTGGWPPPHRSDPTDDTPPPPEPTESAAPSTALAAPAHMVSHLERGGPHSTAWALALRRRREPTLGTGATGCPPPQHRTAIPVPGGQVGSNSTRTLAPGVCMGPEQPPSAG
jgi:hypothetical protein